MIFGPPDKIHVGLSVINVGYTPTVPVLGLYFIYTPIVHITMYKEINTQKCLIWGVNKRKFMHGYDFSLNSTNHTIPRIGMTTCV